MEMSLIKCLVFSISLLFVTSCGRYRLLIPNERVIHEETGYLVFWGVFSYFSPSKVDTSALFYANDFFSKRNISLYYFPVGRCEYVWSLINNYGQDFYVSEDLRKISNDTAKFNNQPYETAYLVPIKIYYYLVKAIPVGCVNCYLNQGEYFFNTKKKKIEVKDYILQEVKGIGFSSLSVILPYHPKRTIEYYIKYGEYVDSTRFFKEKPCDNDDPEFWW